MRTALMACGVALATATASVAWMAADPPPADAVVTLVVTTTDDTANDANCVSGVDCTLRQAVNAAATDSDDTIVVLQSGATYDLDFGSCTATELAYTGSNELSIQGNGATIRQTCPGARVIHQTSGSLALDDVTITGGNLSISSADGGGAIRGVGDVTITDSAITNNSATSSPTELLGGALYVTGGGNVDIARTAVSNTTAASSFTVSGGALFVEGNLTLTDVTIADTTATSQTGNVNGGAIQQEGPNPLTLVRSTIQRTTATTAASFGLDSGAVQGGALVALAIVLEDSTIADTTATGAGVFGGAALSQTTVDLRRSRIEGTTANYSGQPGGAFDGGAVASDTSVTMHASEILATTVDGLFLNGGAINTLTVTLRRSTIAGTTATATQQVNGVAINGLTVEVVNSTVSDNTGIAGDRSFGGVNAGAGLRLVYATIAGNSAAEGANVFLNGGNVVLQTFGSVIALPSGSANCGGDGTTTSHGYNFSDDGSCGLGAGPGDRSDAGDPRLGPLADNGGATLTRLPLTGSPLIDAIPLADCQADGAAGITVDQRGVARPQGMGCDIGAVEVRPVTPPTPPTPPPPPPPGPPAVPVAALVVRFTG